MLKAHPLVIIAALVLLFCPFARGSGFTIILDLSQGKSHQTAKADQKSLRLPVARRDSLGGSATAQFVLNWSVVRSARDTATDVLVHCYVVRLDRPGQAPPALEPKRVVIESALTMDFPAGDSAKATLPFRVDGPGLYLVRVEAAVSPDAPSAGDYAEMELVAK